MDKIAKIDAQIGKAKLAYDAMKSQSDAAWEKFRALQNKRGKLLLEQYKGEDFVPDILLNPNLPESLWKEQRRQWQVLGLDTSGYNGDIYQNIPQIKLTKEDNTKTDAQYHVLCKLLPFMKSHDGVKRVSIFEHTLSAGDVYSLHVYDNRVCLHTHYRGEIKTFESLLEAMTYVQKNYWYESSERRKYDEENED